MRDQAAYDGLDTQTLANLLLNPGQRPDVHRSALSALSRRNANERTRRILDVLQTVVQNPDKYDQQVMMATIDILATDPDWRATEAMLGMLPHVLKSAESKKGLIPEFREYFCEALVTRQREDDLDVWRESLPKIGADTLMAMLFDPAASSLSSLEPMRLIARLPDAKRSATLRTIFFRTLFTKPSLAFEALTTMISPNRAPKKESRKKR
jgi:hypothetical protein